MASVVTDEEFQGGDSGEALSWKMTASD